MGRFKIYKIISVALLVSTSLSYASMPVDVIMKGCVIEGKFTPSETDFVTHKVKDDGKYIIKCIDRNGNPIDLSTYNGKMVLIEGQLIPGDYLYTNLIKVIGNCQKQTELQGEK